MSGRAPKCLRRELVNGRCGAPLAFRYRQNLPDTSQLKDLGDRFRMTKCRYAESRLQISPNAHGAARCASYIFVVYLLLHVFMNSPNSFGARCLLQHPPDRLEDHTNTLARSTLTGYRVRSICSCPYACAYDAGPHYTGADYSCPHHPGADHSGPHHPGAYNPRPYNQAR